MTINPGAAPYNCDLSGLAVSTAGLQAAIDAAIAAGEPLAFTGTIRIDNPVTIAGTFALDNASPWLSRIILANPAADGIRITAPNGVSLRGLNIESATRQTAGAGVRIDPGGSVVSRNGRIEDVRIMNCWDGVAVARGGYWNVECLQVNQFRNMGMTLANLVNADEGDHTLDKSLFLAADDAAGAVGLLYTSSGGLKMTANKFLGGLIGVDLAIEPTKQTADLIVNANSIEGQKGSCVRLRSQGGVGTWRDAQITANQLYSWDNGFGVQCLVLGTVGQWIRGLSVVGNNIRQKKGGTGIWIDGAVNPIVTNNSIWQEANGTISRGVVIGKNVSTKLVKDNPCYNVSQPLQVAA